MANHVHNTAHDTTGLRAGASGARSRMVWPGVSHDTKFVSWLGATVCVSIWRSKAAIQRWDTAAACCDTACYTVERARDTTRSARYKGLCCDTNFLS